MFEIFGIGFAKVSITGLVTQSHIEVELFFTGGYNALLDCGFSGGVFDGFCWS